MSYRVHNTSLNMPDKLYKPGDIVSDEAAAGIPAGNLKVLLREGVLVKEGEPEQDVPESGVIPLQENEPAVDMQAGKSRAPAALAREIVQERGSEEPTRTEEQAMEEIAARREAEEEKLAEGEGMIEAVITPKGLAALAAGRDSAPEFDADEADEADAELQAELDEEEMFDDDEG